MMVIDVAMRYIYPVRMRKGVVIGRVIIVVVVSTKVTTYQDVGTWVTHTHLESIEFGEKLASIGFKSRDTIHERQK